MFNSVSANLICQRCARITNLRVVGLTKQPRCQIKGQNKSQFKGQITGHYGSPYKRRPFWAIAALAASVFLSACQTVPSTEVQPADPVEAATLDGVLLGKSSDRSRVARDLVSALRQIDGLQPSATGFTMKTPDQPFAHSFSQALIDARYDLKLQDNPSGDAVVSYEIKPATDNPDAITIIVSADRMKIKRDYRREDDRTKPASSLFVLGANPDNIILDSAIFEDAVVAQDSGTKIQTAASSGTQTYNSLDLPPIVDLPATAADGGVAGADPAPVTSFAIRSNNTLKRKRNIYEIGESNFVEVLKSYQDVDRRVLVFGNDSMRLGGSNKWFVKTMSQKFNQATDAFSVIGCSFGYTKIRNGNALLALGRAHRVKEELLRNGVPENNILDEGCWSAGENDQPLPSRGVVLVLKRRV